MPDDVRLELERAKQRLARAKAHAVDHPWTLVAFGALAGVWAASHGRHRGGVVGATLGAVVVRIVRDVALYEMGRIARTWLAESEATRPPAARPAYTH